MSDFLGIARESVFSPGKVDADRAILDAVADRLRARGHAVEVVSAEAALARPAARTIVFAMCQGDAALATLRGWEEGGVRVVNCVESILDCHRHRQVERLRRAGVRAPEAIVLSTAADGVAWPAWLASDGGWMKRGDVHATEAGDVALVRGAAQASEALRGFAARGIARAVLQRHVAGTSIKFYAVGESLLGWFAPPETPLRLAPAQVEDLRRLAVAGARALALEVYGGDCIVDPAGALQLVDLNDWPSFAPCRAGAADAIALHLETVAESRAP